MFYYDCALADCEKHHKINELLSRLRRLYRTKNDVRVLNTIMAYSWYFAVSHEYDKEEDYDCDKLTSLWNSCIDIGIKDFCDDPCFNFLAGYTLGLHYIYIGAYRRDEKEYLKFMAKAAQQSADLKIKLLAENFIANEKNHTYIYLNDNEVVYSLFPSDSLLDIYFRQIYLVI